MKAKELAREKVSVNVVRVKVHSVPTDGTFFQRADRIDVPTDATHFIYTKMILPYHYTYVYYILHAHIYLYSEASPISSPNAQY